MVGAFLGVASIGLVRICGGRRPAYGPGGPIPDSARMEQSPPVEQCHSAQEKQQNRCARFRDSRDAEAYVKVPIGRL